MTDTHNVVDLTLAIGSQIAEQETPDSPWVVRTPVRTRTWRIGDGAAGYTARVHDVAHWSMAGTYVDFPGHVVETDDGVDACSAPLGRLFRVDAKVIHLDRASGSGAIGRDELVAAAPAGAATPGLVINALGRRRFDEIEERSVYLSRGAVDWIVESGVRLLVSDVYESSAAPQDVFRTLFRGGVYTVCYPVNLHALIAPHVRLTVLPLRMAGATQLSCRVVAEQGDMV